MFYGRIKGRGKNQDWIQERLPFLEVGRWGSSWPRPLWLEIGFGYGENLLAWMASHPQAFIIGVEVFQPGLAHFLSHLPIDEYPRCALFPHPVEILLPLLPAQSLECIFILFPDPWPKRRHAKRRLVQGALLQTFYHLLQPHGQIVFASDHADLVTFTLNQMEEHPGFHWKEGASTANPTDWPPWPESFPSSRYHQKAIARGQSCAYMVWEKVE